MTMQLLMAVAGLLAVVLLVCGYAARGIIADWWSGVCLRREGFPRTGDFVHVGAHRGTVEAVGRLAVTMRTPDNLFVRVPNCVVARSSVACANRHAIRRLDFEVRVRVGDDMERVRVLLDAAAGGDPNVLVRPPVVVRLNAVEGKFARFVLIVWFASEKAEVVRGSLPQRVWQAFNDAELTVSVRPPGPS
ncbi:MAG: mechanosensitive ion channel [Opitutales bacterium]|nr:mechanosensitive ion channel [Opitutales bacterium]